MMGDKAVEAALEAAREVVHPEDWRRRALAAEAMLAELAEVSEGSTMRRERDEARAELEQVKAEVARLREALKQVHDCKLPKVCKMCSSAVARAIAAKGGGPVQGEAWSDCEGNGAIEKKGGAT